MITALPAISLAVVGAAFKNKDGSDRAVEIEQCLPGEQVILAPEPDNPHDGNAVAVYTRREVQIGYFRAERARWVHAWLNADHDIVAVFQRATDFGAWIRLSFDGLPPVLTDAMIMPKDEETDWGEQQGEPDFYPDEIWPDD